MPKDGAMPEKTLPEIDKKIFIEMAELAVEHSGGELRIAHNECDDSKEEEKEAAHFLKFDEKRLGRDLELYGLMSLAAGPEAALVHFLQEVILPLKGLGLIESYKNSGEKLKELGLAIFEESMHEDWKQFFS